MTLAPEKHMDRATFFGEVRSAFGGHLTEPQVSGIETILTAWELRGDGDDRKLAYLLGTTRHETAGTMQPITEYGSKAYFKKYELGTDVGKRLGNTQPGDGYLFRGRGFVQLTGRANYRKFDAEGDPDKALEPDFAAAALIVGCMKGRFTGKALGAYINDAGCDFVNARRVVNGTDRADLIATYATSFLKALEAGRAAPSNPPALAPTRWSLLEAIIAFILKLFGRSKN